MTAPAIVPPLVPTGEDLAIAPTQTFAQWQAGFRKEALAAGIRGDLFDRAFIGVSPDMSVIKADRSQPEFTRPVWEYLDGALSPLRVNKGKSLIQQNAQILQSIEQRYGVDREALVAVWGMESNFGQFQGSKSVINSLATLAYEGRRPGFAHAQLIAALQILQQGDITPEKNAWLLGRRHGPDPVHSHHVQHPCGGFRRRRSPRHLGQLHRRPGLDRPLPAKLRLAAWPAVGGSKSISQRASTTHWPMARSASLLLNGSDWGFQNMVACQ
nr:hypothetical protein GCM10020185_44260 [Pseudomonas brassicacearum subsp. brassicacearum]